MVKKCHTKFCSKSCHGLWDIFLNFMASIFYLFFLLTGSAAWFARAPPARECSHIFGLLLANEVSGIFWTFENINLGAFEWAPVLPQGKKIKASIENPNTYAKVSKYQINKFTIYISLKNESMQGIRVAFTNKTIYLKLNLSLNPKKITLQKQWNSTIF